MFASHKQYLSSLLTSRKAKNSNRPKYTTHFITLSEKKRPTNLKK